MSTYTMSLKNKYYKLIESGEKIYELRLFDDKRRKINVGDTITFFTALKTRASKQISFDVVVEKLIRGKTFEDIFKQIPAKECGFESPAEGVKVMKTIYPLHMQEDTGVIAIKVKKVA